MSSLAETIKRHFMPEHLINFVRTLHTKHHQLLTCDRARFSSFSSPLPLALVGLIERECSISEIYIRFFCENWMNRLLLCIFFLVIHAIHIIKQVPITQTYSFSYIEFTQYADITRFKLKKCLGTSIQLET